jgi:hypothetical protein
MKHPLGRVPRVADSLGTTITVAEADVVGPLALRAHRELGTGDRGPRVRGRLRAGVRLRTVPATGFAAEVEPVTLTAFAK